MPHENAEEFLTRHVKETPNTPVVLSSTQAEDLLQVIRHWRHEAIRENDNAQFLLKRLNEKYTASALTGLLANKRSRNAVDAFEQTTLARQIGEHMIETMKGDLK